MPDTSLPIASPADIRPEWVRMKDAVKFSGISRPKLYSLIDEGKIRSVSLRERGQIKGTRLVNFDSLRGFLEKLATGGDTPTAA